MKFEVNLSPETSRRYREAGHWVGRSITDYLDDAVARTPGKMAIVAPGVRLTYAQLDVEVNSVAAKLRALGIGKGDVVSIQLNNCPEFVITHLACSKIGAVTNPLLPLYRASELTYILNTAKTVAAVIPNHYRKCDYPAMYAQMWPTLPDLKHVLVVGGEGHDGMRSFESLRSTMGAPPQRVETEAFDGDDVTALIFTSGTESNPKGVMHSHNTHLYGTLAMAKLLGLTGDDVVWTPSPVGHGTGYQWGVRQAITLGATLVLQDGWDADEALRLIAQERCTFTLAATPFASMLMESPLLGELDLSSFRIFACAGATIPEKLGIAMRDRIGCTLVGMWGMTECFVGSSSAPGDPGSRLWGSDGKAMPGCELAIFDEARTQRLPKGEVGELAVRGPNVSLGYFSDPLRTRETFSSEGWLFSGDLATMDEEGYIRLVGRKKEIINRGALKISVRQMEEYLLDHPKVRHIAMVGVPDPTLGEKSCAFVVARDKATLELAEISRFLDERGVAKYKFPEYLVLLEELPTTPSGKIQKYLLREGFVKGAYAVLQA